MRQRTTRTLAKLSRLWRCANAHWWRAFTHILHGQGPGSLVVGFPGYLLRSEPMRRQIVRIAQGISVLGISKGNLEKLTFWLPHPDEQQKIAGALAATDAKIQAVADQITNFRPSRRACCSRCSSDMMRPAELLIIENATECPEFRYYCPDEEGGKERLEPPRHLHRDMQSACGRSVENIILSLEEGVRPKTSRILMYRHSLNVLASCFSRTTQSSKKPLLHGLPP